MELKIVEFDEKILRQETVEVELPPSHEVKLLAAQMIQTMVANNGLGMATPQIDHSERMFVAILGGDYHVFINPTIDEYSDSKSTDQEACLSLPGVTVNVRRSKIVRVTYYDASGTLHARKKFKRMDARVIQHEFDHLNGKLIVDYANDFELGA